MDILPWLTRTTLDVIGAAGRFCVTALDIMTYISPLQDLGTSSTA